MDLLSIGSERLTDYVGVCNLCSGCDLKYGNVKKFLSATIKHHELLRKFNRSVDAYIKKINANPHKIGLRCKKELADAETVTKSNRVGTMKLQDRIFVERWSWEEDNPGKNYEEEGLALVQHPLHNYFGPCGV